jgi:hypothetical protein
MNFVKTTAGNIASTFSIDPFNPAFAGLPDMLPEYIAEKIAEFLPSAMPNRTYDREALLGPDTDDAPKTLRKALLAICSLPQSQIVVVPGKKPGRERYQLNPAFVVEQPFDMHF